MVPLPRRTSGTVVTPSRSASSTKSTVYFPIAKGPQERTEKEDVEKELTWSKLRTYTHDMFDRWFIYSNIYIYIYIYIYDLCIIGHTRVVCVFIIRLYICLCVCMYACMCGYVCVFVFII